jgi:formyl-CoA transferase
LKDNILDRGSNNLPASTALNHLTVIDLTRVRSGPTCVRQFSDWGANVIKVEMPGNEDMDFSARADPDFQNLHRNKRSITLNLKAQEGVKVLKRLVEKADIIVENYRPDVKHRLGIDYENLRKINSQLIYTSISGFGEDGPYRERPGVDQISQGMSGLMSITGEPERGPMRVGIAISDLTAGVFAALGTMVALQERTISGEGQWVQTSLLQSQMFMLDFQAARWLMSGEVAEQAGNNHPTGVPTGCFATKDGFINIAPTPAMWPRFCGAIGHKKWIKNPNFATREARLNNRDQINAMIEEETLRKTSAEWIQHFNSSGIPCGPINTIEQAFADPQVKHSGLAQTIESPSLGTITLPGQPIKLSRTPSKLSMATPDCGEHNDEVLTELGYTHDEIIEFRANNVI